ncbi:MAG: 16S rRNA (adenine(1518)-N(6)/adenine(1519)-N(6))-dimethyltransferase RsmA [Candidatus Didemnitutus sp.]|nr:16S rRNA (adenine(1518)-N(6)/adenine(1519)-N(6))-dimethyltransferase RsmA [Candidatus Didemnitutus sp.]
MPLTPSSTRELLARLGHQPKRFLGQNFLIDGNIVRKSLELAGIQAGDAVVEVGPGLGTLTTALLEAGAEVWAVELDANLTAHLRETLVPLHPKLHLLEGDGVEHPRAALAAEREANYKIVANLPYAISTPWMDAILSGPLPARMVLMLQQEAAQRYVARPGSKQFGAISIFVQSAFATDRGHKVGAGCFYPAPDIESVLLNLVRRPAPFIFSPATKLLIRACFQQRRKQIASLLRDKLPDGGARWLALLPAAGLDGRARPEDIPVALWQQLDV